MADEESNLRKEAYLPPLGTRLLIWFGIYLAGLMPFAICFDWKLSYGYPFFLSVPFLYFSGISLWNVTGNHIYYILGVAYALYLIHLIFSLLVRRRKIFYVLMWTLLGLVLVNFIGYKMLLLVMQGTPA